MYEKTRKMGLPPSDEGKKAVFFDRDGTLIREKNYLKDPAGVELLEGAAECLRVLKERGFLIVIVSNQSGVARGMMTEEDVRRVNARMLALLRAAGAEADGVYYCPHHPAGSDPAYAKACDCRKPNTGMALRAAEELGICLSDSYMVGDKEAESGIYISTVKKAGILSSHLVDEVKEGDVLEVSRPAGRFVYERGKDCAHVTGVAGGAGITSMLSMAKAAEEGSENYRMTLFFCVKNAYEFLFRDVLDGMKSGRVQVVYVVENDAPDFAESGVFTRELLHKYVNEATTLFACGGNELYGHILRELRGDGSVRGMKFSQNSVTDREDDRMFSLSVHLAGREYVIPARASETLMVAMERAGLGALSQCRVGECGFCRSTVTAGRYSVHPEHDERSSEDVRRGIVHPCCTYPESDMEISVPQDPAAEVI